MARLCLVPTLGLVLLVLWAADGLLLTKTRMKRDAHRADQPRRILGPGLLRDTPNDAHDHITDMLEGGQASQHGHRRRNPSSGRNPANRKAPTSTASPTTTSSTTAATTIKPTQKTVVVESTNLKTAQKELSLRPVILADRLIPRTDFGKDVLNFEDGGVANLTHSNSAGIKVTVMKEDTASETKLSKQFFPNGLKSQPACNLDDPTKPKLVAGCGSYYLFPGYNVKLIADSLPCVWRFRYTAPTVILSSTGRTSKHDFGLVIQEGSAANSQDANATASAKHRYGLGGQIPRDLVIEMLNDTNAVEVPAEICVPADPQNAQFDEYDLHEGVCCRTAPDTKCGIPNGSINDEDFGMKTFPWEAVLTVTMKPANSDTEDVSYCSGTLISDEWLLTTAACFIRPKNKHPTTTPEVSVGLAGDTYGVKEYIVYPTSSEAHDITLVRLDRKSTQTPVCLPPFNKGSINEGVINQTGIVFGWVLPEGGAPYMSTRNQRVISSSECSQRLGEVLSPHILCTEDRVTEEEPCLADGDLLVGKDQFTLRGLSNPRLTCKNDLREHTSIEHFMPWISSITGIKMTN